MHTKGIHCSSRVQSVSALSRRGPELICFPVAGGARPVSAPFVRTQLRTMRSARQTLKQVRGSIRPCRSSSPTRRRLRTPGDSTNPFNWTFRRTQVHL